MKFNFKKSLKVLAVIMAVLMLVTALTGCVSKKKLSSATVMGMGKLSIETALLKSVKENAENDTTMTYKWKNGWNGLAIPAKSTYSEKEEQVSLVLTYNSVDDGKAITREAVVYFTYNKKFKVLTPVGGYATSEDGYGSIGKSEASSIIAGMYSLLD